MQPLCFKSEVISRMFVRSSAKIDLEEEEEEEVVVPMKQRIQSSQVVLLNDNVHVISYHL